MSTVTFRLTSATHSIPIDVDLAAARQEFVIDGLVVLQHAVLTPDEIDFIIGGAAARATTSISHLGTSYRVELQGGRYLDTNPGDIVLSNHARIKNDLIARPPAPASPVPAHRQLRPPKTWYCPIPGCSSSFNRSDNLRRHLKDVTRGPQHIQYVARQPDAPIVAPNRVNTAVERLASRYPSVALVPEARGFEEVPDVEDKFSAICRGVHAVLAKEFPEFNLWAEVRFGGNRADEDAAVATAAAVAASAAAAGSSTRGSMA